MAKNAKFQRAVAAMFAARTARKAATVTANVTTVVDQYVTALESRS